jgi:hypothetical protein
MTPCCPVELLGRCGQPATLQLGFGFDACKLKEPMLFRAVVAAFLIMITQAAGAQPLPPQPSNVLAPTARPPCSRRLRPANRRTHHHLPW